MKRLAVCGVILAPLILLLVGAPILAPAGARTPEEAATASWEASVQGTRPAPPGLSACLRFCPFGGANPGAIVLQSLGSGAAGERPHAVTLLDQQRGRWGLLY